MPDGSSGPLAHRPPFALIASITVTGIMANTLVTAATPDVVASFGIGSAGLGLLLAATTGPGVLLAPVIGLLADRYGRRTVVVPCLALFGLAGGLAAFATTFPLLLALRFAQGIGSAGLVNLAVVIVSDHWEGTERARMLGRNAAALTAGIAVLPPLGGALADLGGWRLAFAPYWLALVTAVVVWRLLPPSGGDGTALGGQIRRALPTLRSPTVLGALVLAFALFSLVFGVVLTALPVHLKAAYGVGASGRGLVLAVPAISSTAVALLLGRLRARYRARWLLVAGPLLMAAGFATIGLAPTLAVAVAGPLLYGLGEGLMIPTLQDVVAEAAPPASRGTVFAVFVSLARAGQTAGPICAGLALERWPARGVFVAGAGLAGGLALLPIAGSRLVAARRPRAVIASASAEPLP